jgi:hypothetical protein
VTVVAAETVTYVTAAAVALNGGGALANGCGIFGGGLCVPAVKMMVVD